MICAVPTVLFTDSEVSFFYFTLSQNSQFSNNYPSSIFEKNTIDNLTFLSSNNLQPFNPNTLYSQHTSSSTPNIGFTRPALPPTIPETLEHTKTTLQKDSIQKTLQSLKLPNHIPIIRIPYIAHVIQLSLKELLD
ncbi:unnamed protein product [Penicillium camemberti]|uniref:Str. FM013 n=1 Tax=Penicillium camemberti (strain FM 013) TaxID=1429867 RepID=A0A0G4PW11_PENC3|nr:unnamed protein product [Penicillium camemberti]